MFCSSELEESQIRLAKKVDARRYNSRCHGAHRQHAGDHCLMRNGNMTAAWNHQPFFLTFTWLLKLMNSFYSPENTCSASCSIGFDSLIIEARCVLETVNFCLVLIHLGNFSGLICNSFFPLNQKYIGRKFQIHLKFLL